MQFQWYGQLSKTQCFRIHQETVVKEMVTSVEEELGAEGEAVALPQGVGDEMEGVVVPVQR